MKKLILSTFAVAMFLTIFALSADVQAQERTPKSVKSKTVSKSRGANPNIKQDVPTTDKVVAKSRSASCVITLDNYTGYYIKVYVDGNYKGTLDAWGGGTVTVGNGFTTVYCVTVGGTKEWETDGNCQDSENYFKIED